MVSKRVRPAPNPVAHAYQRRVGELLDSFGDCYLVLDADWRVLECNGAAEKHFGRQPGELVGRPMAEVAPKAIAGELHRQLARALVDKVAVEGEAESEAFPGRWLTFRAFPVDDGVGVGFRDISEARDRRRKGREQARDLELALARVAELESRHAFLLQLADTLRNLHDPNEILNAAASMTGERLNACRVGYAQVAPDGQNMITGGNWNRAGIENFARRPFPMRTFGKKAIDALLAGKVVAVSDVSQDRLTSDQTDTYARLGARSVISVPLLRDGRMEATFTVMAEDLREWTADEISLVEDVATRTWSTLQRALSERALRESEARFRSMADCAPSPGWVTSASGDVEFVNQAYSDSLKAPAEKLLGNVWLDMIHPEDRPHVIAVRAEARRKMEAYTFECRMMHPDGQYRILRASCRPRFDENGVFQGYVGMSQDVTSTRRAEERQRLLINELNHRVKNTLATVQSIIHQILRRDAAEIETRRRITERLIALSSAHDVLTRQNWLHADLIDVICEAMRAFTDPQAPRVELSGPAVKIAPGVAVAMAMALHELGTNAVRHGALSAPSGHVSISWRVTEGGAIELEWRERGGPMVHGPPSETGFGSRLLQGLVADLGKPAELEFTRTGLVCRLCAPVAKS